MSKDEFIYKTRDQSHEIGITLQKDDTIKNQL